MLRRNPQRQKDERVRNLPTSFVRPYSQWDPKSKLEKYNVKRNQRLKMENHLWSARLHMQNLLTGRRNWTVNVCGLVGPRWFRNGFSHLFFHMSPLISAMPAESIKITQMRSYDPTKTEPPHSTPVPILQTLTQLIPWPSKKRARWRWRFVHSACGWQPGRLSLARRTDRKSAQYWDDANPEGYWLQRPARAPWAQETSLQFRVLALGC